MSVPHSPLVPERAAREMRRALWRARWDEESGAYVVDAGDMAVVLARLLELEFRTHMDTITEGT